jgi:hypothetical protein
VEALDRLPLRLEVVQRRALRALRQRSAARHAGARARRQAI